MYLIIRERTFTMAAPIFTIVGEYKTHEEAKTKLRGFSIIEDSEEISYSIFIKRKTKSCITKWGKRCRHDRM